LRLRLPGMDHLRNAQLSQGRYSRRRLAAITHCCLVAQVVYSIVHVPRAYTRQLFGATAPTRSDPVYHTIWLLLLLLAIMPLHSSTQVVFQCESKSARAPAAETGPKPNFVLKLTKKKALSYKSVARTMILGMRGQCVWSVLSSYCFQSN